MANFGDLYKKFGRRIRQLRKQRQWTQEDLSHKTGLSVSFLSKIESKGEWGCKFETLEIFRDTFEVPVKELFNFDELES
jgi:transcriptional regulator with XRE-family HTH domain